MVNIKVIQLIQHLSPQQRKKLRTCLSPGLLNKREAVHALYLYIDDHVDRQKKKLEKTTVLEHMKKRAVTDDQRLRHHLSYLHESIEKFLVFEQACEHPIAYQLGLAAAYRQLQYPKGQKGVIHKLQLQQQKDKLQSTRQYRLTYDTELEIYEESVQRKRTAAKNLQALNDTLDLAYLAEKLKDCCLALAHQNVSKVDYDTGLLPFVLAYLKDSALLQEQPLIGMYYYYFMAATHDQGQAYFLQMRSLMQQAASSVEQKEQRSLYLLAINYGIKQFNRGDNAYLEQVFELYKEALNNALLLENGQLSPYAFKNIGSIAIRLKQYDWAQIFIATYQPMLPTISQKEYVQYMHAKLHYAQQSYDMAMQILARIKFNDVFLNLDSKILYLKIFYEQEAWETLDAFVTSTQRYLERLKVLSYHRKNYGNTLYFTKKLIGLNFHDKQLLRALEKQIQEASPLGEKEWLLQQIAKFK